MDEKLGIEIPEESTVATPPIHAVEGVLQNLANLPSLPKEYKSRNIKEQFINAFELIGGIPRLAHWAHQNPGEFFKLYSKLLPASVNQNHSGGINISLSWLDGRDTSGRSRPAVIDVTPEPPK